MAPSAFLIAVPHTPGPSLPPATATAANGPATNQLTGRKGRVAALSYGAWVMADQAVVSIANFATSVFVGRFAGQEQLGFYILAYSAFLTAFGLAKALVWTPYTKQTHALDEEDRPWFAGSATVHLVGFALLFATCVGLLGLLACRFEGGQPLGMLFLVLAPCSLFMLLREHYRRLCLASFMIGEAFVLDVVVSVAQIGGLLWISTTGHVSALNAYLVIAAACCFAVGRLFWRSELVAFRPSQFWSDWLTNWKLSKWLVSGASAVLLGNQGYRWLLPALTSMAELGKLGSAQGMIQFANPLVLGVSNFLGPITARVHAEHGFVGLWKHTVRSTLIVAACVAAILLGLAWFGEELVHLVYLDAADGVTRLLLLTLGAGMLSEVLLVPVEFATLNRDRGRLLMTSALMRLTVNLTLGFGLVWSFGAVGIGIGMLTGSILSLVWQWKILACESDAQPREVSHV